MMLATGVITFFLFFSICRGHEITNAVELLEKVVEILEYSVRRADEPHHYDDEISEKIDRIEMRLEQLENGTTISSPKPTCAPCPNQTCTHCPDKWIRFKGSCFFFVEKTLNFAQAKSNCIKLDAYLVHIETGTENEFLKTQLRALQAANYWMGLTDVHTEGQFEWDDDNSEPSFTDWSGRQPDNGAGKEHCAEFTHRFGYKWNDIPCHILIKSVCEM